MSIVNAYGSRRQAEVMHDTWGHLAPEISRTYTGTFVFALGLFGDLAVVEAEFEDLPDSPWFYDDLHTWIWDQSPVEGRIYRFDGTYRRDRAERFVGSLRPAEAVTW